MEETPNLFLLIISAIFVKNILLAKFLGNCPFLGVSKKMDTASGMGMAVVFVMVLASLITFVTYKYLLAPYGLEYLRTIAFILVIASLVQFVEMFIKKTLPALYKTLGIFLPLITTNCAILFVALVQAMRDYGFLKSILFGFGAGIGFTLAIVIMAGIREQLETADIPKPFQGAAVTLIVAGVLALAFMGFTGLVSA